MRAADQKADAGLDRKRETQVDRIAAAMRECLAEPGTWEARARHVLAAVPEPHVKKERGPKQPFDDCMLIAMRSEFASLVRFIEANADHILADRPLALARVLREQGVV